MSNRNPRAKRKKKNRVLKAILIVLLVFLMMGIAAGGAFFYLFGTLNTVQFTSDDEELGVSEEVSEGGITNIALFGVDTRDTNSDSGRSDAIIILTVDQNQNIIKLTSILRDSKVNIEGYGENKINAAYAYGGAVLAIKTLNQNFNLDIKDYVTVNFSQLADIVDAVGGITLTLTQAEVDYANSMLRQSGETQITGVGEVILNGDQAVAYSRIRKIDSDSVRASRQQNVLSAVFEKIKTMSKSDYPSFIRQFLGTVETSLSYSDILGFSSIALNNFTMEQNTVPDADYETDLWGGIDNDGIWYWIYDLNHATERIHAIIYGDDSGNVMEP
jgi:LCP family protein required for cell wall assembly